MIVVPKRLMGCRHAISIRINSEKKAFNQMSIVPFFKEKIISTCCVCEMLEINIQ
mgnify:CR=1 FL=1